MGERQLNIWELYQWYQALNLSWPEMMQELDALWSQPLDALEEKSQSEES